MANPLFPDPTPEEVDRRLRDLAELYDLGMALREIRSTDAEPADRVMESPPRDSRPLSARETQWLLDRLCMRLGFCLPPDAQADLKKHPPTEIDGFVSAVFLAEGLDPTKADRHLYGQVRREVEVAFVRRQPV
jgi:hypothetical protein